MLIQNMLERIMFSEEIYTGPMRISAGTLLPFYTAWQTFKFNFFRLYFPWFLK
jgi:hypothetical protein